MVTFPDKAQVHAENDGVYAPFNHKRGHQIVNIVSTVPLYRATLYGTIALSMVGARLDLVLASDPHFWRFKAMLVVCLL